MATQNITTIDVETGGLNAEENPITQIALVNFNPDNFKVNWEYSTFVKPYGDLEITPVALQKSMVTMKDIQDGIEAKDLVKELIKLFKSANTANGKVFGNTILMGHNIVGFDRTFLEYLFLLHGKDIYEFISKEFLDTLPMCRSIWPKESKQNLTACCERIGHKLTGAHGALADTRANYELFKYIVQRTRAGISGKGFKIEDNQVQGNVEFRKGFNF